MLTIPQLGRRFDRFRAASQGANSPSPAGPPTASNTPASPRGLGLEDPVRVPGGGTVDLRAFLMAALNARDKPIELPFEVYRSLRDGSEERIPISRLLTPFGGWSSAMIEKLVQRLATEGLIAFFREAVVLDPSLRRFAPQSIARQLPAPEPPSLPPPQPGAGASGFFGRLEDLGAGRNVPAAYTSARIAAWMNTPPTRPSRVGVSARGGTPRV